MQPLIQKTNFIIILIQLLPNSCYEKSFSFFHNQLFILLKKHYFMILM